VATPASYRVDNLFRAAPTRARLIEIPGFFRIQEKGEAEFLGRWLLAAVEADKALEDQHKQNPALKDQISRLEICYKISFSPPAMKFAALLLKNLTCFTLDLRDELWGERFMLMAEIDFFRLTGDRYQMTLPQALSGLNIEAALLKLAATEDQEYYLHPEQFVSCLSKVDAETWQGRLERLPWMQRVADRSLLLGEI
jgi:hypothetical protein